MKLIRLFGTLAWITIFGSSLFAQAPNLEFNLRYNTALSRYEVYARPSATQATFNWGPSQISVVAPASVTDAPFNVTSVVGGAWLDNSNVYAPAAAPSSDFHGIGSLGAPTSFTANVEKLIFHFTLSGGGCTPGLRLFINGVDPDSGAPGMAGGDFSNTVFAIVPGVPGGYEAYIGNYNNSGTSCNAPPVAVNDVVTTNEDTPTTFNPLANDTDDGSLVPSTLDLDPSTPGVQTTYTVPGQGTFVADPVTGLVTFTPVLNYNGTTTPITYSICDNGTPVLCATATITINVTPVNDPPVAVNDAATTPEDTPVTFSVTGNDTDVDGTIDPATLDLDPTTAGIQTTFTVAGQGTFVANPANGNVTFTPVLNYNGTTTPITYSVCDNGTPLPAQCATATITVTVTPVNDPPVAVNDAATTPEDTPVTITILSNDSDVDGALVPSTVDLDPSTSGTQTTFTVAGQGTFTVNASGVVTFTPVLNYNGTTTPISYSVCDNGTPLPALCATATITVTVTPVNDPPVAVNDVATTNEDTSVTINILANDSDVDGSLVPSTVDLDPTTPGIQTTFTTPGQGTFTVNASGVVTFTPVSNYNGTTTPITYSVCDNGTPTPAQCATATITVTVNPVNDPPVAVNDTPSTNEDTPVTFNPLTNDSDVDGTLNPGTLDLDPTTPGVQTTFTVPGQGTFVANPATGQVTFTPVINYNGTTTPISYSICDTGTPLPSQCATATITVTVNPVNDPPVAVNDAATTPEDTPVNISILANDSDVDGSLVPASVDLDPSTSGTQTTFTVAGQGTFTVNASGVVTFTPVLNYNGTTTPITYSVCDNGTPLPAQCATATITVTVTPVNDPPVAVNDVATTNEDTPVNIAILANDSDVDGSLVPSTIDLDLTTPGIQTTFTVAGQGTFTVNGAGVVTFTPVSNFNGTTTPISYNVCDNGTPLPALCATATITVTVNPVNDPPVANNDTPSTNEDTPVTFNPLANDTDVDGTLNPATLDLDPTTPGVQTTYTIPGQGTFTANPVTGQVTFTPVTNYNGTTTPITYNICDNGTPLPAQCASATITVTVNPVNDPPVAVNDAATTPEDTPVNIAILANDTDVDGSLVPSTIDLDPSTSGIQTSFTVAGQGTFTVNASGVVTFTPVLNYNGTTTPITYSVCDNGTPLPSLCASATITVTVTPANDPPTIAQPPVTTPEDTPITICPTIADPDAGNVLTLSLCNTPANGTTVLGPGNCITFTPNLNYNGMTLACIQVCDQGGLCATVDVPITVTPVNDPPVAVNDVATTPEDTPVTIPVTSNDTDVDGAINPATLDLDPGTAGIQTTFTVAGQGTFVANPANGNVTFTPVANYNGTTTPITYSVCDNGTPLPALCATATITVTVTPVNDPPVAVNDIATTPEDTPVTFPVTGNDTDIDGAINPATLDLDPATSGIQTTFTVAGQGTFVANPVNGQVTFTPVANYNGTTTPITYSVCDNGTPLPAQCATATITVTVTPVNDPPVAVNDAATTPEDTPVTFSATGNDTDIDGAINPASLDLDPATSGIQTTFTVAGQGTFVANPANGNVTFTPVANFNGTTTPITYSVCDNGTPLPAQCATATITVMVTPVNDPPVAVNDVATTPEDTPVTFPVTGNDTDIDGAINPATLDLDPATPGIQTTFTVAGQGTFVANPANGNVTFTPVANYNGTTTPITYNVCDNGTPLPAQCASATITVTVTPVNDPPVAVNDVATTPEDTPVTFPVTGNDTDSDGAINPATLDLDPTTAGVQTTFTVAGQGTFVANPVTGQVTFTPALNYNGTTTPITYSVCDNGTPLPAQCATATITVTVTPVNDPPVAVNDVATTPEDTPVNITILANDSDVDGSLVPSTIDLDPATPGVQTTFTVSGQGTFVVNPATGVVTFTPVLDFSGTTTPVLYSVCDNGTPLPAQCATATITVNVIFDPIAKLQLKVMLQGALIGTSNGLMRDDLRAGGYLPLTEPYTALANPRFTHVGGGGGETTTPAVLALNAGTSDAIVDWVFVELRSTADSSVVLQTRSALVQRDGDVVSAADGVSKLNFTGIVGQQYFVSVKHRNHLGAMTAARVTMNNNATLVDFINASNAQVYDRPGATNYNGAEMVVTQDMHALWAGNTNANNKVKYQGTSSDNTTILTQALAFAGNSAGTYNYNNAFGYFMGDVNMDGKVKYQGTSNDASYIFVNVIGLYTALNTAGLYNYDLFLEQLP